MGGETSVSKCLAYSERFSEFVDKLRKDSELAMRVLRQGQLGARWCNDEVMNEVLGNLSQKDMALKEAVSGSSTDELQKFFEGLTPEEQEKLKKAVEASAAEGAA